MEVFGLGALGLLLLIWVAMGKGETKAEKKALESTVERAKDAKEVRDSVSNPTTRRKLRDILNKRNK